MKSIWKAPPTVRRELSMDTASCAVAARQGVCGWMRCIDPRKTRRWTDAYDDDAVKKILESEISAV